MKRSLFILAAVLSVTMCTESPKSIPDSIRGTWNGEIDKLGLSLVLHIEDTCIMDSPDQAFYGIKAQIKDISETSVCIKVPELHVTYNGTLQGDSLIGTFKQMGIKFNLPMGRGPLVRNRPQTPVPPLPYDTEDLEFMNGNVTLAGTLTLPESNGTAVVLVSGSGKQDRDETLMEHKPFAVLSDALARSGISSLRYDDRECGGSTGVFADATTEDFASDAAAAVRFLRGRGFSKVGLIGHSEGGTIAFMLAGAENKDNGTPDFIVSLAGMADRGDSTLLRQTTRMFVLQGVPKKLAGFAAKNAYKKMAGGDQKWMDYFINLDPAPYISRIECPVLALNGEKDFQVIPEYNLSKVQALCPVADCRLYPDLNHLFQHCKTGLNSEYAHIEETMSEEVLGDICSWISER